MLANSFQSAAAAPVGVRDLSDNPQHVPIVEITALKTGASDGNNNPPHWWLVPVLFKPPFNGSQWQCCYPSLNLIPALVVHGRVN